MLSTKIRNIIVSIMIACAAVAALSIPEGASAVLVSRPILGPAPVAPNPVPASPGESPLQATAQTVKVSWYDRSSTEEKFVVYKRGLNGAWQVIDQVPTRNEASDRGDEYSYFDTDHSASGQCYMIAAVSALDGAGYTQEECTVRPDPSRFPQTDPASTEQWYGLSNKNDGTGDLYNSAYERELTNANQTFGVDLDWQESPALWKIEAQGGPQLMHGQAVALRVWGGGWLKYGHETYGVDLVLSNTPSYEWYVVGNKYRPGVTLDSGSFALWNSAANDYLVAGHRTWGASLKWYKETQLSPPPPSSSPPGVKTFMAYNCISEERPLEMWVSDLTAGGQWTDMGGLDSQYASGGCPLTGSPFTFTPKSGHKYEVRSVDYEASGCANDPTDGECVRSDTTFVGDANGQVVSTTIGG